MNTQIKDIINKLYYMYPDASRDDINRIVKSQFKITQEVVRLKGLQVVNWMYIGKVKPTPFRMRSYNKIKDEQVTGDI